MLDVGPNYVVFVVFWTCFRALLESQPGRQPLFQQAVQLRWVRGQVFYGNKEDKTGVARSFPLRRMFYANIR